MSGPLSARLFAPLPLARVAVLRLLVYGFVPVDVLVTSPWVAAHADLPGSAYQPLLVGRLLDLPAPTPLLVRLVEVALLLAAAVALTGRAPRVIGAVVFIAYFEWMLIAMSYGKVDHDRFAYLVALAVLPTVGSASIRSRRWSEQAAWALRCIELAVIATYLLAAVAKVRYGGWAWANSGVLTWAVVRRGDAWAQSLLAYPALLVVAQWGALAMEVVSPAVLLTRGRARLLAVAALVAFHLTTAALIGIIFLPHLVALTALLPLERLVPTPQRSEGGREPDRSETDSAWRTDVDPAAGAAPEGRRQAVLTGRDGEAAPGARWRWSRHPTVRGRAGSGRDRG